VTAIKNERGKIVSAGASSYFCYFTAHRNPTRTPDIGVATVQLHKAGRNGVL
jgi:hypothetical protein